MCDDVAAIPSLHSCPRCRPAWTMLRACRQLCGRELFLDNSASGQCPSLCHTQPGLHMAPYQQQKHPNHQDLRLMPHTLWKVMRNVSWQITSWSSCFGLSGVRLLAMYQVWLAALCSNLWIVRHFWDWYRFNVLCYFNSNIPLIIHVLYHYHNSNMF